jgi:protein-S-isoprenylcysteine O-methyltransferase Ste14
MISVGVIRHPSYLGLILNALGWVLAFRCGVGVLLTALPCPAALGAHARGGSVAARAFGSDYEAYCKRTSRLIPGVY